jgi:tetratricopeptide (TPR) repeat protein
MSELGRNEDLALTCEYCGCEDDCPKECSTCAIAIKTDGDAALLEKKLPSAIRFYKRALFLEPRFAEAWNNLANAYNMINESYNALEAFNKAIAIDEEYGKALFGKAMTLRKLGLLDEAMQLANNILKLYAADEVFEFKKGLLAEGVEDTYYIVENEAFCSELDNYACEIADDNNLLDDQEFYEAIEECGDAYQPEDFLEKIMTYCRKKYAPLGEQKVRGEYIITSFYGAICAALCYFEDDTIYDDCGQYEYLKDHIDIEFTDRNAERILQTKAGEEKAEYIWSIISPYVRFANDIFSKTSKLTDELILCAMKNAYEIGMLTANYYYNGRDKKHGLGTRAEIDAALANLAASQSDYQEPIEHDARCYSIRVPDTVNIWCRCEHCGKNFEMKVSEGSEDIISKYRELAKEFVELGHTAKISVYCDNCAKKLHPSSSWYWINNVVFTFIAKGSSNAVCSYPNHMSYSPTEYNTALSFLRGAKTLTEISEETKTHFASKVYLGHIKNVLGITL